MTITYKRFNTIPNSFRSLKIYMVTREILKQVQHDKVAW